MPAATEPRAPPPQPRASAGKPAAAPAGPAPADRHLGPVDRNLGPVGRNFGPVDLRLRPVDPSLRPAEPSPYPRSRARPGTPPSRSSPMRSTLTFRQPSLPTVPIVRWSMRSWESAAAPAAGHGFPRSHGPSEEWVNRPGVKLALTRPGVSRFDAAGPRRTSAPRGVQPRSHGCGAGAASGALARGCRRRIGPAVRGPA